MIMMGLVSSFILTLVASLFYTYPRITKISKSKRNFSALLALNFPILCLAAVLAEGILHKPLLTQELTLTCEVMISALTFAWNNMILRLFEARYNEAKPVILK